MGLQGPRSGDIGTPVYARDGHRCLSCGVTADLSVDHIIPISKGGTDDLDNLQTLCTRCNASKRDKLPEDWTG